VPNVAGRHVFVSNAAYTPSGGLAGADALCRSEATTAGLANANTFLALMATNTASAASRFNLAGLPWKRVDNVFVFANAGDLIVGGGQIIAPIDLIANGTQYASPDTWSGSTDPNTAGTDATTCRNWTSASSSDTGREGAPFAAIAPRWFSNFSSACTYTFDHLLCFEP
jgi:hypothetical protein